MKLSNNTIGMLIFLALSTAVFVLMAMRPAVEGTAFNFGFPKVEGEALVIKDVIEVSAPEAKPIITEEVNSKVESVVAESEKVSTEVETQIETPTETTTETEEPSLVEEVKTEEATNN